METDIGNPIEYNPTLDEQEKNEDNKQEEQYYFHPSEMTYAPPPAPPPPTESMDIFKSIDKSTWIIAFAVFLLGFFMGKTMQPVILRYS